jgi:hydrophobe/amphiphile efflux-1 (HAE1) family protein
MRSTFFIKRPIFSSVLSIIIVFAGLLAMFALPVEQYPNITPPQIQVTANYPGASAETISNTVAAPLEQQINGTEDMIYMYSQNSASGTMTLSVFFKIGTNIDLAQTNTQNNVNLAMAQLPEQVQKQGVTVQKQTPSILLLVSMESLDGRYDDIYMSNYANINVVQELQRIPGVSSVSIIGFREYAMRIWLRPDRMAQIGITVQDVINSVRSQNQQFATGRIGAEPTENPVQLTIPIVAQGRLSTEKEFNNIILRANSDGSIVYLKDVARAELGAQNYDVTAKLDGNSSTMIAVYQQYGANALEVADLVKAKMEELKKTFPAGIEYTIPYDTTEFVKISIKEVIITLFEAAVLVSLVVLLFLQNIRATLVPVAAMCVSMIGTLAGMYALGFSLNTLTLFGMVLAVGIVVDDAIVVVENVERNMREFKLNAFDASIRAMEEVSGPVVAIVCVLVSVFVPVAFLGGIAGQLYRQFALTISVSVIISGIVALTLSPTLSSLLLKEKKSETKFSRLFNQFFEKFSDKYIKLAYFIASRKILGITLFLIVIGSIVLLATITPKSFIPNEDQGYLITMVNLPDGASLSRTEEVSDEAYKIVKKEPVLKHYIDLSGFSLLENLNRTNVATEFVVLTDWDKREEDSLSSFSIQDKLNQEFSKIPQAQIMAFNPPAIQGLGTVGGFEFWIESLGDATLEELAEIVGKFIEAAKKRPELSPLVPNIQTNNLQMFIDVDKPKAEGLGVNIFDIYQAIQMFIGSLFVNNFDKGGRVYQVQLQADDNYRARVEDIGEIYVRSKDGSMIPLKSFLTTKFSKGPNLLSRFNGFAAVRINGSAAPGYTTGQAINAMEEVGNEVLPLGTRYSWSGEAYQEKETSGASSFALVAGLIMIFLILSALYERWSLPFAIILATPFGVLGAFLAVLIRNMSDDVYFQIGLLTLIALSAKNAILIVEFAVIKREEGKKPLEAVMEAAKLRFRAILMTSLTFILGVVPLVTSKGAGAASRHSVGTGVLGGMIVATILGLLFVPLFFRILEEGKKS